MARNYFPTKDVQAAILKWLQDYLTPTRAAKLDKLDMTVSSRASGADWTASRAAKLDNIQAMLNTPDGNTLGAWINSLKSSADNAANQAAAAYNKAVEANNNAYQAATNAANANNSAKGNNIYQALNANTEILVNSETMTNSGSWSSVTSNVKLIARWIPKADGFVVVTASTRTSLLDTGNVYAQLGRSQHSTQYYDITQSDILGVLSSLTPIGTVFSSLGLSSYSPIGGVLGIDTTAYNTKQCVIQVKAGYPINFFIYGNNTTKDVYCNFLSVGYTR